MRARALIGALCARTAAAGARRGGAGRAHLVDRRAEGRDPAHEDGRAREPDAVVVAGPLGRAGGGDEAEGAASADPALAGAVTHDGDVARDPAMVGADGEVHRLLR